MPAPSRRQQRAITIRSDHALARLALLARDGRSQVQIIEDALDRMPLPKAHRDLADFRRKIDEILGQINRDELPTMAEFDAEHYDDHGLPR